MNVITANPQEDAPLAHITPDLQLLLNDIPLWIQDEVVLSIPHGLEEIVIMIDQPLLLRYDEGYRRVDRIVTKDEINYIRQRLDPFRSDNRTGISGTLHRISATKDRYGSTIGLHIRIGRSVSGVATPLTSHLERLERGLLLIGPPKAGKTTLLRDIVRILANEIKREPDKPDHLPNGVFNRYGPAVVLVDNSNEIGGDGNRCHPDLGDVTRLQVSDPTELPKVLLEAIINKSPEFVIGDEIGSPEDVQHVLTISKRGARMVASVHGNSLGSVMNNPPLLPLLGEPDFDAKARRVPSVFDLLLVLPRRGEVLLHDDADAAIDAYLRGEDPNPTRMHLPGHPDYQEENNGK